MFYKIYKNGSFGNFLQDFVGMKQIVNSSAVIVIQNVLAVLNRIQLNTVTPARSTETTEVAYQRVQKTSKFKFQETKLLVLCYDTNTFRDNTHIHNLNNIYSV